MRNFLCLFSLIFFAFASFRCEWAFKALFTLSINIDLLVVGTFYIFAMCDKNNDTTLNSFLKVKINVDAEGVSKIHSGFQSEQTEVSQSVIYHIV